MIRHRQARVRLKTSSSIVVGRSSTGSFIPRLEFHVDSHSVNHRITGDRTGLRMQVNEVYGRPNRNVWLATKA